MMTGAHVASNRPRTQSKPGDKFIRVGQPDGAKYYVSGSYYKFGRFGKVFRWDDDEWVLSGMPVKALKRLREIE